MSYRAPLAADKGLKPAALRALIRARPGTFVSGRRAYGYSPYSASAMIGLGQTKTATTPDHTASDWATALTTAGTLAVPIVTAATGQQQATTPAATTLTAQAAPAPSTDWYWPVMGIVGVLTVGGIIFMVTKKPKAKAAPAKAVANRRRSRKNGWRRRAASSWKGKRRSRAKRAS